ncbi:hypothetical protein [Oscillibacter sp.]|uniref:hypothetical protein n=1 Tax=Oscillibacter sp. TaxID=1945593 RepID=UPI00339A784B
MDNVLTAAEDALLAALEAGRASSLAELTLPYYRREFRTQLAAEGYLVMRIDRLGYRRYKAHYSKKKVLPPPINTDTVRCALNSLLPSRFRILSVTDEGDHVQIILEVINHEEI